MIDTTAETAFPSLPPKVAAAIAAVMTEVPKLGKGETNSHGKYNFASIDDFLEAVRPLSAKHGLIILQDEESFEVVGDGKWLSMRFSFTLAHASGETWAARPTRSIMVNAAMGAQAFGAAQSYALKQFMRSLFQIATGEKGIDADEHAPGDLPKNKRVGDEIPRRTDPGLTSGLTITQLKAELRKVAAELADIDGLGSLEALLNARKPILDQCRNDLLTWWDRDGDTPGFKQRIETKRIEIEEREAMQDMDGAVRAAAAE